MKRLVDDAPNLRNDDCHRVLKWESLPKVSFHALWHILAPPDASEWDELQDSIRDAGTLLGGIHPGYLCPRDDSGPEGGRENHGKGPDGSTVNTKNFSQKRKSPEAETRPPGTFFARMGQVKIPQIE